MKPTEKFFGFKIEFTKIAGPDDSPLTIFEAHGNSEGHREVTIGSCAPISKGGVGKFCD